MRISGAKKVHYESGPNMTPLVDVVMVILIFLMLAGSFAGTERYLESASPITKNGGGNVTNNTTIPDAPIEIRLDASNVTGDPHNFNFIAHAGRLTTSDPAKLEGELTTLHDQMLASGVKDDKMQVYINPGVSVKYQTVIRVYEAALRAKFTKVGFKTAH